jgi:hypothetical protein
MLFKCVGNAASIESSWGPLAVGGALETRITWAFSVCVRSRRCGVRATSPYPTGLLTVTELDWAGTLE